MPAKLVDRAALAALGTAGTYLLLLNTGLSIPVCCVLTFLVMAASGEWLRARRRRVSRAQAEAALLMIAQMPEADARAALERLSGRENVLPALRHPAATLSADAVLGLWRARMGEAALTIAATCPAAPEARALAEALEAPRIELIDSRQLVRAIRRTGQYAPPPSKPVPWPARCAQTLRRAIDRPMRPRAALYGLSLLAMYLTTGRSLCLTAGIGVLGVVGVSWIRGWTG